MEDVEEDSKDSKTKKRSRRNDIGAGQTLKESLETQKEAFGDSKTN